MTNPDSLERRQMAEPRPAPEGADVGGMSSTADAGLGRYTQRSTERAETDPVGPASTGHAGGGADAPATAASARPAAGDGTAGTAPPPRAFDDDDEDEWRHEPREPVDENPVKSFGKAVGDALTGSVDDTGAGRKPPR